MSKQVSVSESWGPMDCEVAECTAEAWDIVMSDREYHKVLDAVGADAQDGVGNQGISFIFAHDIGIAVCEEHAPVALKGLDLDENWGR